MAGWDDAGMLRMLDGKVPDASKTLIEERLKYTDKELARAGLRPGYRCASSLGKRLQPFIVSSVTCF